MVVSACWFWGLLFVCLRVWLGSLVVAWGLLAACCTGFEVWFDSISFAGLDCAVFDLRLAWLLLIVLILVCDVPLRLD